MNRYTSLIASTVPYGSRVIMYGAGKYGKKIWDENAEREWIQIVAVVDRCDDNPYHLPVSIHCPDDIEKIKNYDYILMAIKDEQTQKEISNNLICKGIDRNIIRGVKETVYYTPEELNPIPHNIENEQICNESLRIGISFKLAGLGDQIFALKVYEKLAESIPDCIVDLYTVRKSFTEAVYFSQPNLGNIYEKDATKIDYRNYDLFLEISMQILVRYYNSDRLRSVALVFYIKLENYLRHQRERYVDLPDGKYTDIVLINRARVLGYDRYRLFSDGDLVNISDNSVTIYSDDRYIPAFQEMHLKDYITFNYGADGVIQGEKPQIKMWPREYYVLLIDQIKKKWPNKMIVQIGAKNCDLIEGADKYVLGESLELIKHILINCVVHLDCEGGLMHLATQLGTKCIVLYGPTPRWFLGYDQNINIRSGNCGECMGLTRNTWFECYRSDKPDCMYSITPDMVMRELDNLIE